MILIEDTKREVRLIWYGHSIRKGSYASLRSCVIIDNIRYKRDGRRLNKN